MYLFSVYCMYCADNIFAIKSWIKNKFNFDDETLNKQFGLPDELDYVD